MRGRDLVMVRRGTHLVVGGGAGEGGPGVGGEDLVMVGRGLTWWWSGSACARFILSQ